MKSPFNDEKFINRRNFLVEQAPLEEVIQNYAVHTQRSTVDYKGNQTQRYYLTYSTSNNNRQAQEFNLPNALVTVKVENELAESKVGLFTV